MRRSPLFVPLLAVTLLLQASGAVGGDEPATHPTGPMRLVEMASYLLAQQPSRVNPLAIEQARELVAGRPGKAWKNCLLEQAVRQSLQRHTLADSAAAAVATGGWQH